MDFVCERAGEKKYLQVAYLLADEEVVEREYRSLQAISNDAWPRYLLSMDQISLGVKDGITHLPLRELEALLQ